MWLQLEVVRAQVWGGGSWMWLVPTFMSVAVGIRGRLGVTGSGVWLVPKSVSMAIGCDWYPRVW